MDWDIKTSSWDFENFVVDSAKGENHASGVQETEREGVREKAIEHGAVDCKERQGVPFFDLKLGRLGDLEDGLESKDFRETSSSSSVASPASSSKRARATNQTTVVCQVDGCNVDLSSVKDYHRRHKVCEVHAKTPMVRVNGIEQRFCQQCSRFHRLEEFDEGKRSCRKRLDGHNRRRRKPQPESYYGSPSSLLSRFQGGRLGPYVGPQLFQNTMHGPNWPEAPKTEQDNTYNAHHHPLHAPHLERQPPAYANPVSRGFKTSKQFPFLQSSTEILVSSGNSTLFSQGLTRVSDCALSLLSTPTQSSSISLTHIMHGDRIPMAQPMVHAHGHGIQFGNPMSSNSGSSNVFSSSGLGDDHVGGAVIVSDANDAELQGHAMMQHHHGHHGVGSSKDGSSSSQGLPFSW
ncbi:hypothetical protein AMTRI_Chr06g171830 [Amborella trichopoda]|uniref:SBP-type domain-containing protein n=1 Tax=Amborella trichopoda TaxID=13333 RepID=W1PIU1_AMBTC|nr:teosinte glume architecture 1 [Amborella trichopoda]ERN09897.1 hypothetical protein AMTR_s00013p00150040 [Amborella trichopoda]|eukprot:XP_006848316.1 teosinte glume architecture 1 [Amborella trichopoda]